MVAEKNGTIRFYDLITQQAILSLECEQTPLMSADWCLKNTLKIGAVAGSDWLIWDITRSRYLYTWDGLLYSILKQYMKRCGYFANTALKATMYYITYSVNKWTFIRIYEINTDHSLAFFVSYLSFGIYLLKITLSVFLSIWDSTSLLFTSHCKFYVFVNLILSHKYVIIEP